MVKMYRFLFCNLDYPLFFQRRATFMIRNGFSKFKLDLCHLSGTFQNPCNHPLWSHFLSDLHQYVLGHHDRI